MLGRYRHIDVMKKHHIPGRDRRSGVQLATPVRPGTPNVRDTEIGSNFSAPPVIGSIGDDDLAAEHYLVCADSIPAYLPGVTNLGMLYEERGEANAAIDCFRQVLA